MRYAEAKQLDDVVRALRQALHRLEMCSEIDGDLARYLDYRRILSERIAKLDAEIAIAGTL